VLLDARVPTCTQNPATISRASEHLPCALDAADREGQFARDSGHRHRGRHDRATPLPVDGEESALALDPAGGDNLAAHAWLWKDQPSAAEAAAITLRPRASTRRLVAANRRHVFI